MNFTYFNFEKQIDIKGLYTFYYQENNKTFRSAGEKHNFWEIVYVDGGALSAIADNVGYTLNQGDVIFHKPMEFHIHAANNDKTNNIMIVSFETQSPQMNFFANKIFSLNIKQKKVLSDFFEYAKQLFNTSFIIRNNTYPEFTREQITAYQICILLLERFLLELIIDNTYTKRKDRQSLDAKKIVETAFSDSIKEYLDENICTSLNLDAIANHFNVSKSFLCQLFKNETNHSIIDYFIDLKISTAKSMIREGNLNLTQISERLNYSSIHDFTRSFKKKVNMSPSQYRSSITRS